MVLFDSGDMNVHTLTRNLTLALIAALTLVGVIHIAACDQMMCDPGLTARPHAPPFLNLCSVSICAPLAISASALGLILARLPGQLSESSPILSTVSLPHIVPPPRAA